MQALIDIILPVFLVIGAGYLASWRGLLPDNAVDGLMGFTQTIAIPCLLFRAIWQLDLGENFAPPLLISFYAGATAGTASVNTDTGPASFMTRTCFRSAAAAPPPLRSDAAGMCKAPSCLTV